MYVYPIKPDEIFHYGMPRRSGRYSYASGDKPYQSEGGRTNTDALRIRSLDKNRLDNMVDEAANDILELRKEKELKHSAKGSEWEDHKYVKKIDGVYYYPVGYEDGRTIDSLSDKGKKDDKDSKEKRIEEVKKHFDQYLAKRGIDWRTLPKDEVDQMQRDILKQLESGKETGTNEKSVDDLAKDVASGKLGNGDDGKALLGEKYEEVQKKVNELLKGFSGDKKISEVEVTEEASEKITKATSKVSETKIHSGVDLSKVLEVYNKKK